MSVLAPVVLGATGAPDRLDRFRELAASRLSPAQIIDGGGDVDPYREIDTLLDEEIVESLASGGVFASTGFLQDRLDAFGEAWGGAVIRLVRLGRLLVAAVQLSEAPRGNSVRIYGRLRDEAALLTTLEREGRPTVHPLPPAPGGAAQFLVVWEGAPTGRGTRALRFDLAREQADGVTVTWTTAALFPEGLMARSHAVSGSEIRVRYELHYPGWAPGCERQTEQEDVYRLVPGTGEYTRVSRREHDGWHRELHRSAARVFDALAAADGRVLALLVPDPGLRQRLPRSLRGEPACDAPESAAAQAVSVAAVAEGHLPWTLTFRRAPGGWRLTAATPVLH
jgi:hypothetical protein